MSGVDMIVNNGAQMYGRWL